MRIRKPKKKKTDRGPKHDRQTPTQPSGGLMVVVMVVVARITSCTIPSLFYPNPPLACVRFCTHSFPHLAGSSVVVDTIATPRRNVVQSNFRHRSSRGLIYRLRVGQVNRRRRRRAHLYHTSGSGLAWLRIVGGLVLHRARANRSCALPVSCRSITVLWLLGDNRKFRGLFVRTCVVLKL